MPRTLAAVLAGSGVAVAGSVMQMSMHNRFVSPTTAGTSQFALVGLLAVALLAPATSVMGKMLVASACAVAGSGLLLRLLHLLPARRTPADVTVPLIGLMLGGVVEAGTTFVAWRYDLLQSLGSWTAGDLSRVLAGRYELLWIVAALALALYLAADHLTVAGLGEDAATGLGVDHRRVSRRIIALVTVLVSVSTALVGPILFLGLLVAHLAYWAARTDRHVVTVPMAALVAMVVLVGGQTLLAHALGNETVLSVVIEFLGGLALIVLLIRSGRRS